MLLLAQVVLLAAHLEQHRAGAVEGERRAALARVLPGGWKYRPTAASFDWLPYFAIMPLATVRA
ncbi:hypothetical protein [Micromonospora sp. NPDC048830]|uniref:hypothetical protein n=1 Tax=Micromonospora sp. NPDC048830 TaxID=3364257 RepID=UPI00371E9252